MKNEKKMFARKLKMYNKVMNVYILTKLSKNALRQNADFEPHSYVII